MDIYYNEEEQVFHINTPRSSYVIGIFGDDQLLVHLYYGEYIPDDNLKNLVRARLNNPDPDFPQRDRVRYLNLLPMEYPTAGTGDFRAPCLEVESESG